MEEEHVKGILKSWCHDQGKGLKQSKGKGGEVRQRLSEMVQHSGKMEWGARLSKQI